MVHESLIKEVNIPELVKALRCDGLPDNYCKGKCSYADSYGYCDRDRMIHDAAAAIEALQAEIAELKRVNMEIFEDLPKRGEWENVGFMAAKCSCCGEIFYELDSNNYCPNCGAKMEVQDG